jgi:hypothetical protein
MKGIFVKWIVVLLLFSLPFTGMAQAYHRLAARDFAGTPPPDDAFAAYTYCYVNYFYNATRYNGNYTVSFNVQLMLGTNRSWIRFNQVKTRELLQEILRHEQGHYNIAYLMRNELYSVFTHHRYTANYQAEIAGLFKQVDAKYHKLNQDYENETQHMTDTANQEKWNTWFSKQLDNVEIADNNTVITGTRQ